MPKRSIIQSQEKIPVHRPARRYGVDDLLSGNLQILLTRESIKNRKNIAGYLLISLVGTLKFLALFAMQYHTRSKGNLVASKVPVENQQ